MGAGSLTLAADRVSGFSFHGSSACASVDVVAVVVVRKDDGKGLSSSLAHVTILRLCAI